MLYIEIYSKLLSVRFCSGDPLSIDYTTRLRPTPEVTPRSIVAMSRPSFKKVQSALAMSLSVRQRLSFCLRELEL